MVAPQAAAVRSQTWLKMAAARSRAAAGLPDPHCKTGTISLADASGAPQVCCAGYCGECSDYPTCKSVRGQASEAACCKTKVYEMRCGNAPANVCLKQCTDSVPPCIMPAGETFAKPDPEVRHAGDDCTKAADQWKQKKEAATALAQGAPRNC